jgi:hypothetical protein
MAAPLLSVEVKFLHLMIGAGGADGNRKIPAGTKIAPAGM